MLTESECRCNSTDRSRTTVPRSIAGIGKFLLADYRIELVVLDLDTGAKRRAQGPVVDRSSRTPSHSVKKRIEALRGIEGVDIRQGRLIRDLGCGLELPHDVELVAEFIVDRCEVDEVVCRSARCRSCALDACDRPLAAPDADELALLGNGRKRHGGNDGDQKLVYRVCPNRPHCSIGLCRPD